MDMFVVEVETTSRDLSDSAIDHVMTALAEWHSSVGAGLAGTLEVTLTLPAEDLRQAVAAGIAAVVAAGLIPIGVSALPEKLRDARAGWVTPPELASVTEAAAALEVTRQRVLQMITAGKLPATRVGTTWVIPRSALPA
jgi:excisionase family DNA binding protein